MSDVHKIFGIKKDERVFINPQRQNIEQFEDYSVKKVIHTQEIIIDKLMLDQASNTYFKYNHTSSLLELFVNGVKVAEW